MRYRLAVIGCIVALAACAPGESPAPSQPTAPEAEIPSGWATAAPRDELRPRFSFETKGGPKSNGAMVLTAAGRLGLHGWFQKSFLVTGGKYYRFSALRQATNVAVPRRSVYARVVWRSDDGKPVPSDPPNDAGHGPCRRRSRNTRPIRRRSGRA